MNPEPGHPVDTVYTRQPIPEEGTIRKSLLLMAAPLKWPNVFRRVLASTVGLLVLGVLILSLAVLHFPLWLAVTLTVAVGIVLSIPATAVERSVKTRQGQLVSEFLARWPHEDPERQGVLVLFANMARTGPSHLAMFFEALCKRVKVPEDTRLLAHESLDARKKREERERQAQERERQAMVDRANKARMERQRIFADGQFKDAASVTHLCGLFGKWAADDPKAAAVVALCHLFASIKVNIRHNFVMAGETEWDRKPSWMASKAKAIELVRQALDMLPPDSRGKELLGEIGGKARGIDAPSVHERYLGGDSDRKFLDSPIPAFHIETLAILSLPKALGVDSFWEFASSFEGHEWLFAPDDF